jgi:hypothetical protein
MPVVKILIFPDPGQKIPIFVQPLSIIENYYPHHPQPKLAVKRIENMTTTISHLSSKAMMYLL